jgi:hypothetical protein
MSASKEMKSLTNKRTPEKLNAGLCWGEGGGKKKMKKRKEN